MSLCDASAVQSLAMQEDLESQHQRPIPADDDDDDDDDDIDRQQSNKLVSCGPSNFHYGFSQIGDLMELKKDCPVMFCHQRKQLRNESFLAKTVDLNAFCLQCFELPSVI